MDSADKAFIGLVWVFIVAISGLYVFGRLMDHRGMHQCIDRGGSPSDGDGCDMKNMELEDKVVRLGIENREIAEKLAVVETRAAECAKQMNKYYR